MQNKNYYGRNAILKTKNKEINRFKCISRKSFVAAPEFRFHCGLKMCLIPNIFHPSPLWRYIKSD